MNPASLGAVKAAIRTLTLGDLTPYLEKQIASATDSLREQLKMYMIDHGIFIE
jgi:signal transduction protein with GAF and PtsI domain